MFRKKGIAKTLLKLVKNKTQNKIIFQKPISPLGLKLLKSLEKWNSNDDIEEREDMVSQIQDIAPINIPSLNSQLSTKIDSLSSGFDIIYGMHDAAAFIRREEEKLIQSGKDDGEKKAKLVRRSEQQKIAIEKFLQRAAINQELGKSIQENWSHVNDILEQFNQAITKDSWQSVEKKIGEIPWIDKINPSKSTIVIFLPDEEGGPGTTITLEVGKNVHQNAQRYFGYLLR